jgi:hypothetical protein
VAFEVDQCPKEQFRRSKPFNSGTVMDDPSIISVIGGHPLCILQTQFLSKSSLHCRKIGLGRQVTEIVVDRDSASVN